MAWVDDKKTLEDVKKIILTNPFIKQFQPEEVGKKINSNKLIDK